VFNAVTDYLNRQFPASARRLAELSLGRDPKEALFHAAMGMVLEAEGKKPQAEEEYLNALYLDPTSLAPMSRLYVMYQASADAAKITKLQRLLEASLEKKKDSAVHHDWLGQVYLREGRLDQAEMSFTTAIGLAPKNPEFRISLGGLRARQGKYDEAVQAFEEALKLQPNNRLALYDLGTAYALQGKFDKAIDAFKRAERAGQPSAALYNALAQACEENNDPKAAVEYLRRSLTLKPQQPDRREQLRRLQARIKK
jgi:tetratricopeptide (TPR) repeat protein